MKIPLNPDEVRLVVEASAFLNAVHNLAFNTLAALTPDDSMGDPRVALVSLSTSCDALLKIRRDVTENPYLTDDHVGDILDLQDLITKELLDLRERRIDQSIGALEGGVIDGRVIEVIRHAGLSKESAAMGRLEKLFNMVEKKITPPFTTISLNTRDDKVAELVLRRPKANAFDLLMMKELTEAYGILNSRDSVRAVLMFSDDDKFFSSGIDLKWLHEIIGDEEKNRAAARAVVTMFNAQKSLRKPMIIAVDQLALGGGVEFIAAANDTTYVIAGSGMRIQFPISSLGILPSAAMPDLINKTGVNNAMQLFSGFNKPGNIEAKNIGLVDEAVPNAKERAEEILTSKTFPAIKRVKPKDEAPSYEGIPEPIARLAKKVLEKLPDKSALDKLIEDDLVTAFLSEEGKRGLAEFALGKPRKK